MKNTYMKYLFVLPFWAISIIACAQSPKSVQKIGSYVEEKAIFHVVEESTEFPGGYLEYFKFLKKNIRYPKSAQEKGIQGWVGVQFIVNKEGDIVSPTIIKKLDPSLDAEALRVIKMMPKWKPGKRNGKTVNVKIEERVIFGSALEERIKKLENPTPMPTMHVDEFNIPYEFPEEDPNEVLNVCEEMPEFPGGMQECMKFISKNIKYPPIRSSFESSRILVNFIITREGNIVDPIVVKGVDPKLNAEALRVIKMMPKWKPGKHRGKAVHTTFTLPVMFRAQ